MEYFNRVTSGVLVIDQVTAINDPTAGGFTLTLEAVDLDITDDRFVNHQVCFTLSIGGRGSRLYYYIYNIIYIIFLMG